MKCPYCKSKAEFKSSEVVYGGRYFGMIWICSNYPKCDSYVGVHKGTEEPLGRMANKELREWKMKVHKFFDPIWRSRFVPRDKAYRQLARKLNIPKEKCHIGMFDVEMCKKALEVIKDWGNP